jgi:hypothetical protein
VDWKYGHQLFRPTLLALDIFHKSRQVITAPHSISALSQVAQTQNTKQAYASRDISPECLAEAQEKVSQRPVAKPVGEAHKMSIRVWEGLIAPTLATLSTRHGLKCIAD